MKKIIVLAVFSFLLVVGLGGCKKEEPAPVVYYSDWSEISWVDNSVKSLIVPQITQEILESGIVFVYAGLKIDGKTKAIFQVPNDERNGSWSEIQMIIRLGSIDLYNDQKTKYQIRYVIIPGQAKVSTMGMSYSEVKEWYNIPD